MLFFFFKGALKKWYSFSRILEEKKKHTDKVRLDSDWSAKCSDIRTPIPLKQLDIKLFNKINNTTSKRDIFGPKKKIVRRLRGVLLRIVEIAQRFFFQAQRESRGATKVTKKNQQNFKKES